MRTEHGSASYKMDVTAWYTDWQNPDHVRRFDFRSALDRRNLVRNFESLNDVRLLNERLDRERTLNLLEVGCATGEFYRYLQVKFPRVSYYGVDISRPAIERAHTKYPQGRFSVTDPDTSVRTVMEQAGLSHAPEIIYAKDVVHHQVKPFGFVSELLEAAIEAVIVRCRTRDVGKTELDPELSCQYHYGGWMPYIILNLEELIAHIRHLSPQAELLIYRNHIVLGGQHNRYLPKDCYLRETGTAETAVGVFQVSNRLGKVTIADCTDQNPRYTWDHLCRKVAQRFWRILRDGYPQ